MPDAFLPGSLEFLTNFEAKRRHHDPSDRPPTAIKVSADSASTARDQYQRVLGIIRSAKERRAEFEHRLAALHADTSLSESALHDAVSAVEEDLCAFLHELLANEDLSPTVPQSSGNSPIPLADFLRQLREKAFPSTPPLT
ncbi:unnamed protein product [Mesocestoides corti]|uniref:Uncharacterized protein n=1 Tax=Mesocestoides corti TaxID=53468 RepID=A0A0R3UI23_MESCO|nr:unnamed protein product [Mesocestoides corti]